MSDLDALERLNRRAHHWQAVVGAHSVETVKRETMDGLVQRLRQAEKYLGEHGEILSNQEQLIRQLEARVAQLERMREAVIDYLGDYIDRDALNAALDAVEEKNGG